MEIKDTDTNKIEKEIMKINSNGKSYHINNTPKKIISKKKYAKEYLNITYYLHCIYESKRLLKD